MRLREPVFRVRMPLPGVGSRRDSMYYRNMHSCVNDLVMNMRVSRYACRISCSNTRRRHAPGYVLMSSPNMYF